MDYSVDQIIFGPDDVDLERSPLRASMRDLNIETYTLGAFNPGLTRLLNGNLLMMVRVAEALRDPVHEDFAHTIRWTDSGYRLSLPLRGEYRPLRGFVSDLQKAIPAAAIDDIDLGRDSSGGARIEARMRVTLVLDRERK